jgi:hypothetical protein
VGDARGLFHHRQQPHAPLAVGTFDPLDYEHYVDTQVRAVAEPVLLILGLDFAHVVGDARQLRLF